MMADFDLSSERAEDSLPQQEEIQTFNNNLFQDQLRQDPFANQIFAYEGLGTLDIPKITPRELSEHSRQDHFDSPKDTLDLNYQAEIPNYKGSNAGSSQSQHPRLEDLLRDADSALRRSQHLSARLTEDPQKFEGAFSSQNEAVPTLSVRTEIKDFVSSPPIQRGAEFSGKTTSSHVVQTNAPEHYQYYEQEVRNSNSDVDPSWGEIRQSQPQSIESWKSKQSPESKYLSPSYTSKIKATYDLFPIQEAIESGVETPRHSNVTSFGNPAPKENSAEKLKAFGFSQPASLADQVLNQNYSGIRTASSPLSKPFEPAPAQKGLESGIKKSTPQRDDYLPPRQGDLIQPTFSTEEGYYSSRSYKIETKEDSPEKDSMDKKIDELLNKHLASLQSSSFRASSTLPSKTQGEWKYSLPNTNPMKLPPTQQSDAAAYPFDTYGVPRDNIDRNTPNKAPMKLTSPVFNSSEQFRDQLQEKLPNSSARKTFETRYSDDIYLKQDQEATKRSGNSYAANFASPHGTFPRHSEEFIGRDADGKAQFKFSSPLLHKYYNPFVSDYFANGNERPMNFARDSQMESSRQFSSNGFGLENFTHKVVESKEQSPEREYLAAGQQDLSPYPLSSQPVYSPKSAAVAGERFENFHSAAEYSPNKADHLKKDLQSFERSYDVASEDPYGTEFRAGEKRPSTQFESNRKAFQQNPSQNIDEDFGEDGMAVEFYGGSPDYEGQFPFGWKEGQRLDLYGATPEEYRAFLDSERRFEPGADFSAGHETTPDKKLKKLTFKNRPSEERTHEKGGYGLPEENSGLKINGQPKGEIASDQKQRKKIFGEKDIDSEKRLQEELLNSERMMNGTAEKDAEKQKRIIFSEMPERKGKEIETLLEPLQENKRNMPPQSGNSTQRTPRAFEVEGSERFPFQLKNGVMDPTESFFDFENENFLTNEDYTRQTKTVEKPKQQRNIQVAPVIIQPSQQTSRQQDTRRKKPVSGKLWVLAPSENIDESVNLSNPQAISQNLKQVPILRHCFMKFGEVTFNFPTTV